MLRYETQDRKHVAAIARLERQQTNQAAVLKRKAEEAAAANSRLKELLQKQKVVTDSKAKRQEAAETSNVGARIRVCGCC